MEQEVRKYSVSGRKKTKEEILESHLTNYKVKCKCGHTIIIIKRDKVLCNFCGHYVYRNKKEEFKDKMRSLINGN